MLYFMFNGEKDHFATVKNDVENEFIALSLACYPFFADGQNVSGSRIDIKYNNHNTGFISIFATLECSFNDKTFKVLNKKIDRLEFVASINDIEKNYESLNQYVEYYGDARLLAIKNDLKFLNDGKNKQSEVIGNIISDNIDKYNESINTFREIEKIASEVISTLKKKNDDYGNSYIKNIERFGKQAMLIPMFNKLDRLESLSKKENQNFESFEDSLKDLIGYCLMATEYLKRSK